jgi:SAM-dependent methyltransferase
MEIAGWDERYRNRSRPKEDLEAGPSPLVIKTARGLLPGRALDLACGAGRNALWLAAHGWTVTAVDGSKVAVDILRSRAEEQRVPVNARIADLEKHEFDIETDSWDLIAICYYLQLDLIESSKRGVKPGGVLLVIVHVAEPGEQPTKHRLAPGDLIRCFEGWEILHSFEGKPNDPAHHRAVAEIVARRPG